MQNRVSNIERPWRELLAPRSRQFIPVILSLALLCFLATIFGLGLCQRTITPDRIPETFSGFSRDKWIQDGAVLRFPQLAKLSHRVTITFGNWRAITGVDPLLRTEACGSNQAEVLLTPDALTQSYLLSAKCHELTLYFPNAPTASATDPRRIGAQLSRVVVTSPIGVPVFAPTYYLNWVTLVLALTAAVTAALWRQRRHLAVAIVAPMAFLTLASFAQPARFFELQALIAATTLVFLGTTLTSSRGEESTPGTPDCSSRRARAILACIIVLGCALRLYGITFGLPELFHTDEGIKVRVMKRMLAQNTLDPNYFLHPTLLLYVSLAFHHIVELFNPSLALVESLVLAGRLASAAAGTVSIFLVYVLTALLFSRSSGLLAAALLAVSPLAVTCSRYLKEDSLFCLFLLLTVWLTILAVRKHKVQLLYLAGLSAGLCASAKYTGALSSAALLAAPWIASGKLLPERQLLGTVLFALALVPVGFIIGSPYALLNWQEFLGGLHSEHRHMLQGHHGYVDPWSHFWVFHLTRSVAPALTLPVCIMALVGIGLFIRRCGMRELLVVGIVFLLYLPAEWVKAKPAPQPERYILGCLPFLAIISAESIRALLHHRSQIAMRLCSLLLISFPLVRSLTLASEITDDTRTQMTRWIAENVPPSAAILVEARYAPKLRASPYRKNPIDVRDFYSVLPLHRLKKSNYDYLLISSFAYDRYFTQAGTDPNLRRMFSQIFAELPLVKEFSPRFGSYGFHNPTVRLYGIGKNAPSVQSNP